MTWTINILSAVLLTQLTGTVMLVCWYAAGRILDRRGFINILYPFLKITAVFFLIPAVFILLWFQSRVRLRWSGLLFWPTPIITVISSILLSVWAAGAVLMLIRHIVYVIKSAEQSADTTQCSLAGQRYLSTLCRHLGISASRVTLYESYSIPVPMLTGLIHPRIIIPSQNYDERSLCVILTHELIHYRNRDILLKHTASFILIFGWFNPAARILCHLIRRWSEYACDYASCEQAGSVREYFQVIFTMARNVSNIQYFLSASLFEDEHELARRAARMAAYTKLKKPAAAKNISACIFLSLISLVSIYAASVYAATAYEQICLSTLKMKPETANSETVMTRLTMDVPDSAWVSSAPFTAQEGQTLYINGTVTPSDTQVTVGIILPDGQMRCTPADSDYFVYFNIYTTGTYYVFITNTSGTDVTVSGYFWSW